MIITKRVNAYTMTNLKGLKPSSGEIEYILEYEIEGKDPVTLTKMEKVEEMTANQAEIEVIIKALSRIHEPCELMIYTDSLYVISAIDKWIPGWIENGWLTARKKPVANKEKLIELTEVLRPHMSSFTKDHHKYHEWMSRELKRD